VPPTARRVALIAVVVALLAGAVVLLAHQLTSPGADEASASPTPSLPSVTATATATASATPSPTASSEPAPSPSESAPQPSVGPDEPPVTAEPAPTTPGRAVLTITFSGYDAAAGAVSVGGFADVIETGGTCTLTLTSGSRTASVSRPATADATTTTCGTLSVPRTQLAAGSWSAVLGYVSPTSSGLSDAVTIEVP
jgi:hypothetical protein